MELGMPHRTFNVTDHQRTLGFVDGFTAYSIRFTADRFETAAVQSAYE
jgi:hypothetical protein